MGADNGSEEYFSQCVEYLTKEYGHYIDETSKNANNTIKANYIWYIDDTELIDLSLDAGSGVIISLSL